MAPTANLATAPAAVTVGQQPAPKAAATPARNAAPPAPTQPVATKPADAADAEMMGAPGPEARVVCLCVCARRMFLECFFTDICIARVHATIA